ncbi:hypothetical protein QA648_35560 (plasmid) [Rhizobium sp. CB3171]|uniref:hypothetical protein n=1 Tax=Rhizobium sp. CB3171 TaxID=3039157 RepID=UPI0024B26E55|nr:hypothetical protein [Rhizobium sp. CB3171]WFU07369.1 hypothetical protein QA648_35560 [Rhizobium sp. CB3171]
MKVFWSWQNDVSPNRHRHFLKGCLDEAVAQAGQNLNLDAASRPELDHDTKGQPGMAEIAATIFRKIAESAAFVADVTPIGRSENGKALPNPNVLVELGWALGKPGPERIVCIFNSADGWNIEDLPFDIRHRRAMQYCLPEGADKKTKESVKKKLVKELADAIAVNLGDHAEEIAANQVIVGVAAASGDRSIWASAAETLSHNDSLSRGHEKTIAFKHGPRAYLRVIPAGWTRGAPTVSEIRELSDNFALWAPIEGGGSGDYGACEEGYLSYWITGRTGNGQPQTSNVCCYFDETGEVWAVHGTAVADTKFGPTFRHESALGNWSRTLRRSMAMLDRFGALEAQLVEVGLAHFKGVRWHGQWESESPPARRDSTVHTRQSRSWGPDEQLSFLKEGFDAVLNNFGLGRSSDDDIRRILQHWDPQRT